jgi:hypothetical protein
MTLFLFHLKLKIRLLYLRARFYLCHGRNLMGHSHHHPCERECIDPGYLANWGLDKDGNVVLTNKLNNLMFALFGSTLLSLCCILLYILVYILVLCLLVGVFG